MNAKNKPGLVVAAIAGVGILAWYLFRRTGTSDALVAAGGQIIPPPSDSTPPDDAELTQEESLGALLERDARIDPNVSRWGSVVARHALENLPKRFPVSPDAFARLAMAHVYVESRGQDTALGDSGAAYGLMQINIARGNNPEFAALPRALRFDPDTNVEYGTRLLATLLDYYRAKGLDTYSALRAGVSAYNAGQTAVNKALAAGADPATRTYRGAYTDDVLAAFDRYGGTIFDSV